MFPDLTWLFCSIVLGAIIIFWNFIIQQWQIRKRTANIPGPSGLPLIGNMFDFINIESEDIIPMVQNYWKTFKPSRILRVRSIHKVFVHIASAEYAQIILSDKEQINKSAEYDTFKPWLGNGLLVATGQHWHTRRKLLTPAFHFRILEDFNDVINYHSKVLVNKLKNEIGKKSFVLFPYITLCTLDIICETSMGHQLNAQLNENSEYLNAVEKISHIMHSRNLRPWYRLDWIFNLTSMGRESKECLKILHGFTDKVIQERKISRKKKSQTTTVVSEEDKLLGKKKRVAFLDMVLDMAENDDTLTDESIRDEVDTFMFAGHDTTGAAITWSLFLIGQHPDVQKKIQEELDSVIGVDPTTTITSEHLTNLKYLDRVIKESLRLYPPAHLLGRSLTKDMKLGDYDVPKGITLILSTYTLHRNPDVFPDPEKFDPDRFLPEAIQKRHPFAYLPFSAGPRNCIGQKFALMEEKIILAHILRCYKVKSLESREEVKLIPDIILRPKGGVLMQIEPRI